MVDHRVERHVRGGPDPAPPAARRRGPRQRHRDRQLPGRGHAGPEAQPRGTRRVKILDQWYDLNAAVYVLDGFSGHADRNDLAWWYEQTGGDIEHAFLVHGEPESMEALAPVLQPHVKPPTSIIPEPHQSFEV